MAAAQGGCSRARWGRGGCSQARCVNHRGHSWSGPISREAELVYTRASAGLFTGVLLRACLREGRGLGRGPVIKKGPSVPSVAFFRYHGRSARGPLLMVVEL